MVTGDMTFEDGDNVAKRFSQTFVLAPGPKSSYYVHNDLIRYGCYAAPSQHVRTGFMANASLLSRAC
jgi:hypothetical protein